MLCLHSPIIQSSYRGTNNKSEVADNLPNRRNGAIRRVFKRRKCEADPWVDLIPLFAYMRVYVFPSRTLKPSPSRAPIILRDYNLQNGA